MQRKSWGWLSTSMWGSIVVSLDEWGLSSEYRELIDTPKAVVEILAAVMLLN